MKYWQISGREADQARRMVKDIQYSKRHKDLQELHIWKEQMRKGADDMRKSTNYAGWRVTWPTSSQARGSATSKTRITFGRRGTISSRALDCKQPPLSKR